MTNHVHGIITSHIEGGMCIQCHCCTCEQLAEGVRQGLLASTACFACFYHADMAIPMHIDAELVDLQISFCSACMTPCPAHVAAVQPTTQITGKFVLEGS